MHAKSIIQKLLDSECPHIHAKRKQCVVDIVQAGSRGKITLMGLSRALYPQIPIRDRIKRVDRLLSDVVRRDSSIENYAAPEVHRHFLLQLQSVLPQGCEPVGCSSQMQVFARRGSSCPANLDMHG